MRFLAAIAAFVSLLPMSAGAADPAVAVPEDPANVGLQRFLRGHGARGAGEERWNVWGQLTYISSWKPSFPAAYTNLGGSTNSLLPEAERSFTATATLYVGLRLWSGAEAYFVPELISTRPFSQLRGLGGAIQNFELQKTGGETPQLYRSRAFVRQSFGLGGAAVERAADQMQLGGRVDRRRLVITLGNFSVLDFLDRSEFTSDPRRQFLSVAFMTHAAWDFAADARGYSWGGAVELSWDDWTLRFARMAPPVEPNQLAIAFRLEQLYGDSLEIEHRHEILARAGAVRLLAFRNRETMGRFDEAIAALRADPAKNAAACTGFNYGSKNAGAPDLCWVRRANVKVGMGVSLEQYLTDDAGLFLRAMWADGESEVQAYLSADRSLSLGGTTRGPAWGRPDDLAGAGLGLSWISSSHAEYLRLGGVEGFLGDGRIRAAPETNVELFYSVNVVQPLWVTLDYQRIWNPGFNGDRGPVDVFGLRVHARF